MTLELNQVALQLKAMGRSLEGHAQARTAAVTQAADILHRFSAEQAGLHDRIARAEKIQQTQRFDWIGAAPTTEPLATAHALPPCPEPLTIVASDGSQIMPDHHAITLYYLINVGSIAYQHGSNRRPDTYNPKPRLYYEPQDLLDERGNLIAAGEVRVKRDLAELEVLANRAPAYIRDTEAPVVALLDSPLALRVIELSYDRQKECQTEYIEMLDILSEAGVILAGYVDRPRSNFVVSLLHLAALEPGAITEEALRQNPFRHLTDLDLFDFLGPGERSAIYAIRAKGADIYEQTGHGIHFFYLNVSRNASPHLARVEVPAWVVNDPQAVNTLHAALVRQARMSGNYPYVLARAHELAIISSEERAALELMLAIELRRQGYTPALSPKQQNKSNLSGKEGFQL